MRIRRIPRYLGALLKGVTKTRPRDVGRLLSQSPHVVQDLPCFGVSMLVDIRDPAISRPILWTQEYEKAVTDTLLGFVRRDTHFVDVGANIGFFSLLVGRRATSGKVWSFEPDPQNFRLLSANVTLNGLGGVIAVHNLAVSDREESLCFSNLGHEANLGARFTAKEQSTLQERAMPGADVGGRVQAICVDAFLCGERVDLVKVDVEGFEPAVFRGMRKLLTGQSPVVVMEFAPGTIRHISRCDPLDVLRLAAECGYGIEIIETGAERTACRGPEEVLASCERRGTHHIDLLLRKNGG